MLLIYKDHPHFEVKRDDLTETVKLELSDVSPKKVFSIIINQLKGTTNAKSNQIYPMSEKVSFSKKLIDEPTENLHDTDHKDHGSPSPVFCFCNSDIIGEN
jgi:hypothetical protein